LKQPSRRFQKPSGRLLIIDIYQNHLRLVTLRKRVFRDRRVYSTEGETLRYAQGDMLEHQYGFASNSSSTFLDESSTTAFCREKL